MKPNPLGNFHTKLLERLTEIATKLASAKNTELNEGIVTALQEISAEVNAQAGYIILTNIEKNTLTASYGWTSQKTTNQAELNSTSTKIAEWIGENLVKQQNIAPNSVLTHSETSDAKNFLNELSIEQLVTIPLIDGSETLGYLCFISVEKKQIWDEICINMFKISSGIFAHAIKKKFTSETIRIMEGRVNSIVDNAPIMFWGVDPNGIVKYTYGKFLADMDVTPENINGHEIWDFTNLAPKIEDLFKRVLLGENISETIEIQGRLIDVFCIPLRDSNGEITEIAGLCIDTTPQKRAEKQLKKIYDAQAKLFSEMAHSLKTPFAIILNNIDILQNTKSKNEYKKTLPIIRYTVEEANNKISQLLKIAKMDLFPLGLEFEDIETKLLIDYLYEQAILLYKSYHSEMQNKDIRKYVKLVANEECVINGDIRALKEAVMVVIDNAIVHSHPSTGLPVINISATKKGNQFLLSVEDNGIGFNSKLLDLYDNKSSHPNKGIGLPLCQKLIAHQCGKMQVLSGEDKGTRIEIMIPLLSQ